MRRRDSKEKMEDDDFSDSAERQRHEEAVANERERRRLVEERRREAEREQREERIEPERPRMIPIANANVQNVRQRQPGCTLQARWPPITAPIRHLKYIGTLFEDRWANEQVVTLQNLVDLVTQNTLNENRTIFQRVFLNPRRKSCVSHSANRPTKNWLIPWPDPPYTNIANRAGLVAGDYSYCVRKWNRCAWESVEAYLRQQLQNNELPLIPAYQQRTNYCQSNQPAWCLVNPNAAGNGEGGDDEGGDGGFAGDDEGGDGGFADDDGDQERRIENLPPRMRPVNEPPPVQRRRHRDYIAPIRGWNYETLNRGRRTNLGKIKRGFGGGGSKHIKYYIGKRSNHYDKYFSDFVNFTVSDLVNYTPTPIQYDQTTNKKEADIIIRLTPQEKINKKCSFTKLSCSIVSFDTTRPDEILISLENWNGNSNYAGDIIQYRTYLITHEFLHCRPFYLDHPNAEDIAEYCSVRNPLPVMYQQTNGLPNGKCYYNSKPLPMDFERTFRFQF